MSKGKDFYGSEIAGLIEQACKELGRPREQLDIEVLETGSSGIFGLCRKKAHIRVQAKKNAPAENTDPPAITAVKPEKQAAGTKSPAPVKRQNAGQSARKKSAQEQVGSAGAEERADIAAGQAAGPAGTEKGIEAEERSPAPECLTAIQERLDRMLSLMGLPSAVQVSFDGDTILCSITGAHEEYIAGQDGRILDNLQYLLRKMIGVGLPEKVTLSLDAAGYRKRRLALLQEQALELAAQARQSGKVKTMPALNPAERQVVHQALRHEGEIRSRSVGSGLLKKILIYKPGREGEAAAGKDRDQE